ncbi:MBL fold metallo-hydrolase [Parasporobacterium paucivorans]|uniref:7,8-dihydropterin-6-yl-methyl-4-(Beta-D-ribofuranosyl)aminobenzene 5'-phosphate synthase n=1 Tax=Parasporobacterium paucivorans DSM 15970 TaxID=1122934 RepID=A0A1M6CZ22_9FIRM|nr:MBL fold metallo-hydrolase [Parasporobacterium paucivorans]SHI66200.1 7,8-dihydropterin-6-yl-methyl-4-(beta-D-ribofuranosyl)aminobenzene 5'-phosphate synthase [Parasporobacterium paucivorans DSM 15970]
MIIRMLVENTSTAESLGSEHGLSVYIETDHHKILFDTGASGLFAENAEKMQIDLSKVDLAVISHGHYDHGGGLRTFLEMNSSAKIYFGKKAFGDYYANRSNGEKKYIGLDKTLMSDDRFVFGEGQIVIDEELELFSGVKGNRLKPPGNQDLFMREGESYKLDDFSHEQNLVIKENGNTVLVAGCAHAGIVNILEHFRADKNGKPSHVIGGFHLYNRGAEQYENSDAMAEIGSYLLSTGAMFYTCHCTGIPAYERLKSMMGESVNYLSTGSRLII